VLAHAAAVRLGTSPPARKRVNTTMHIAILGLGPSVNQYLELTKRLGSRARLCDQVWTINALGDVFQCDLVVHMDDVRVQEIRARAAPASNIAAMLAWLKTSPVPVLTSIVHPDYPALRAFPLAAVLQEFPLGYFNSTAAYAIAYALHLGANKISCYGMDFTYPDAHDAERGRACCEYWLGMAAARGVELAVPKTTTLLDAMHTQAARFYGYDCVELDIQRDKAGRIQVGMTERAELPAAQEIEQRYDHSAHPNALVEQARSST
jgi:hypothetical protein